MWIHLAHDMVQLQALISRVKNKGFQASHTQLMYICASDPRPCDNTEFSQTPDHNKSVKGGQMKDQSSKISSIV